MFALLLGALAGCAAQPVANLDRAQGAAIVAAFAGDRPASFDAYLARLDAGAGGLDAGQRASIGRIRRGDTLTTTDQNLQWRLLGLYTRITYGEEAMATLGRLVEIPTHQVAGLPQHENPTFHRLAEAVGAIASDFGLTFRNVDGRVYEISLDGASDEVVGIHAHGDVVPANAALWVLDDGTTLDPYHVTRVGDRLYGRGTEDDKNGIVVALYAMKVVKDEGLALRRHMRLLIDTTEETTSEAMPYYFERNPRPEYNIAIDGSYPVVIAEKGTTNLSARFPRRPATGSGAEVVSVTGGLASNQIPAKAVAVLKAPGALRLVPPLQELAREYVKNNGDDFTIAIAAGDDGAVTVEVQGVSAHSSAPESGVNPVPRLFGLLHAADAQGLLRRNHITDGAAFITENWGLDYLGTVLGINFADDFMGPLTASPTFVGLDAQGLRLVVNLRVPVGRPLDVLIGDLTTKLDAWAERSGTRVEITYPSRNEPMSRNPDGGWVNALLDVATENLGMDRRFGSSAGSTSVHFLPNGVQFGLAMPNEKYTGHNALEFKRVDQFLLDLQIVTEMIARIGTMPSL